MCNRNFGTGFTQDGGRALNNVVATAAHELGHNFDMNHDGMVTSLPDYVSENCIKVNRKPYLF